MKDVILKTTSVKPHFKSDTWEMCTFCWYREQHIFSLTDVQPHAQICLFHNGQESPAKLSNKQKEGFSRRYLWKWTFIEVFFKVRLNETAIVKKNVNDFCSFHFSLVNLRSFNINWIHYYHSLCIYIKVVGKLTLEFLFFLIGLSARVKKKKTHLSFPTGKKYQLCKMSKFLRAPAQHSAC